MAEAATTPTNVVFVKAGKREVPSVVHFANGRVLESANMTFALHQHETVSNRRLLTATAGPVDYTGISHPKKENVKYLVGVFDRATGRWAITDARMYHMHGRVRGLADAAEGTSSAAEDYERARQQRTALVEAFGGKKKKAEIQAEVRNRVSGDAIRPMAGLIDQALKENAEGIEEVNTEEEVLTPIPPHNKHATMPEEAYDMDQIITPAESAAIKAPAKTFAKAKKEDIVLWRSKEYYPEFVLQRLDDMESYDSKLRSDLARTLFYLNTLMLFREVANTKGGFRPTRLSYALGDAPEEVRSRLLEVFAEKLEPKTPTDEPLYKVNNWKKDLILSHILVLAMAAHLFKPIELETISRDLKMPPTKVAQHMRALGCKVTSSASKRKHEDSSAEATSTRSAVITIPLEFPKPRKGRTN